MAHSKIRGGADYVRPKNDLTIPLKNGEVSQNCNIPRLFGRACGDRTMTNGLKAVKLDITTTI